jgi:hypothetical protein
MFRVMSKSSTLPSYFRLKVFNSTNKVIPYTPIQSQIRQKGQWQYYWFVTTAANTTAKSWNFDIAIGIRSLGGDADLYVSVMDGRYPTESDYDYMSDMIGTDRIRISS